MVLFFSELVPLTRESVKQEEVKLTVTTEVSREESEAWKQHYDSVGGFNEGLARVEKGNEWFHIRPDGEPAYTERFDSVEVFHEGLAEDFSEGLAQARMGDECFHIRPDGEPTYTERYDSITAFHEGLAQVRKNGEFFNIRPDGSRVQE